MIEAQEGQTIHVTVYDYNITKASIPDNCTAIATMKEVSLKHFLLLHVNTVGSPVSSPMQGSIFVTKSVYNVKMHSKFNVTFLHMKRPRIHRALNIIREVVDEVQAISDTMSSLSDSNSSSQSRQSISFHVLD